MFESYSFVLLLMYQLHLNLSGTALQQSDRAVIVVAFHKQFVRDFCVSLGHLQICVSHLPLQGEQIATIFQIESGEAVPELIRGKLYACTFAVFPEVPSQHIGLQLFSVAGREQPPFPLLRLYPQELLQGSVGHGGQIQGSASAGLCNFGADKDGERFGIVVLVPDRHQLACSYAGIQH